MQPWALIQLQRNPVSPCVYVSRYSRLHYEATNKTAWENTDPTRMYHFVACINNTSIADKIAKPVQYTPRTLHDSFERALALEGGLQLAKGVHFGRSPQVMQVLTSASCHHDGLEGCVYQVIVRDSWARSNACWKCGVLDHFQKGCKATLNSQGDDRGDLALSDTNPTIGKMSHTLTTLCQLLTLHLRLS